MPIRFGNFVFTGHRGAALEKLLPQRKDQGYAELPEQVRPPQQPPRPATLSALMPRVDIQRVTRATKSASPLGIAWNVMRAHSFGDASRLGDAVKAHVDKAMAQVQASGRHPDKPVVILMGESHGCPASLVANMAIVDNVAKKEGPPALLLQEQDQNEIDLRDEILQDPSQVSDEFERGAFGKEILNDLRLQQAARRRGVRVEGFDPAHDDHVDILQRERSMKTAIDAALAQAQAGQPVVIVAGSAHFMPLHEHLMAGHDVIGLCNVGGMAETDAHLPFFRKRASTVLASKDDVMLFRPGWRFQARSPISINS